MAKRLFLLIISMFIGVACSYTVLSAAEHPTISDLDHSKMTNTIVPEPEPEPTPEPESATITYQPAPTPTAQPLTPNTSTPVAGNSISIAGRTLRIVDVSTTRTDAGDHVDKYGEKFLYGHNSSSVFGGLQYLSIGSTFSVTYNGVVTNYQVANIVTFEKNGDTLLQINGAGSYMRGVSEARFEGTQYGLSLMTCAGTSLGNGDATHRLVIFANQI